MFVFASVGGQVYVYDSRSMGMGRQVYVCDSRSMFMLTGVCLDRCM